MYILTTLPRLLKSPAPGLRRWCMCLVPWRDSFSEVRHCPSAILLSNINSQSLGLRVSIAKQQRSSFKSLKAVGTFWSPTLWPPFSLPENYFLTIITTIISPSPLCPGTPTSYPESPPYLSMCSHNTCLFFNHSQLIFNKISTNYDCACPITL